MPRQTLSQKAVGFSFLCTLAATSVGCGLGQTKGTFSISERPDLAKNKYETFYVGRDTTDRTDLSEKEARNKRGLDTVRNAVAHELKERGFDVTDEGSNPAIDAYITYGFSVDGESGVTHSYTPGTSYMIRGRYVRTPGYYNSIPYARDDQMIWVEIYDWQELREADFEVGSVRAAWRGQMEVRFDGMDGMRRDEAEQMAMNLLADFPFPRQLGETRHRMFPIEEREVLFESVPLGPSSQIATR